MSDRNVMLEGLGAIKWLNRASVMNKIVINFKGGKKQCPVIEENCWMV